MRGTSVGLRSRRRKVLPAASFAYADVRGYLIAPQATAWLSFFNLGTASTDGGNSLRTAFFENMKMKLLTDDLLKQLAGDHQGPCLSLYQPTHRRHPENQQDPIRFRDLMKIIARTLDENYPPDSNRALLEPFESLGADHEFWNHTMEGLAVFGAPGLFEIFGLQRTVPELTVVADTFHTKPLRRFLQSSDRYQILGLSLSEIKLFEGNRDALDEIELAPGVPRTITDALGEELTEPHQTVASYGGTSQGSSMRHSHGGKKDEMDVDRERFFRAVDRAVLEHHSRPSGLPLMLAALPEHQGIFHQLSQNPFLMAEGLKINPEALPINELRERAWQIVEPQYRARLATLTDEFTLAKAKGLGLEELEKIGPAAFTGRVGTLLIEADRQIAGHIHAGTGHVHLTESDHSLGDDLLDDLGEEVVKKGGRVVVVPSAQMPTKTGAAAINRF